jgi:hypothetical protein
MSLKNSYVPFNQFSPFKQRRISLLYLIMECLGDARATLKPVGEVDHHQE